MHREAAGLFGVSALAIAGTRAGRSATEGAGRLSYVGLHRHSQGSHSGL